MATPWIFTPGAEPTEVPATFLRHGVILAASERASV